MPPRESVWVLTHRAWIAGPARHAVEATEHRRTTHDEINKMELNKVENLLDLSVLSNKDM